MLDTDRHGALYAEQAGILEGRGVDLFMLETFFDLAELEAAVRAVREISSLPIVALLDVDDTGAAGGVDAAEAAERLGRAGAAAVGANHGTGPHSILTALASMEGASVPLAALPNVGLASIASGRVVYPHSQPEYFSEFAAHAQALGARIIGGCCGTTPAQIEAIRAAVDEGRAPRIAFSADRAVVPQLPGVGSDETRLERALRLGKWVVSVELDPPKGGTSTAMIDAARALAASGQVGFVDVNDNPMARARMNALMASVAIQREAGVETIPHVTPRDSTIMGLEGMLLGAHAEGVRNVLAVTGDPPQVGDYPGSRSVYEIDSIGLVQMIASLNEGVDYIGKAIDQPTSFFVGVAVNPTAGDLALELERFERKIAAGARFAMTQALFDVSQLQPLLDHYGGSVPIPVLVGVWPLRSHQLAVRLHNEVPGITVPHAIRAALEAAGLDAPEVGMAFARELVGAVRELAAGIYVIPPFKQPEAALELLSPTNGRG